MKNAEATCYNCGRYMGADYHYCEKCGMLFCSDCMVDSNICVNCAKNRRNDE
jgi:hypothetical protein